MYCTLCEPAGSRSAKAQINLHNGRRKGIEMRRALQLLIGLSVTAPAGLQAQPVYVPFPTREELREIQLQAYACSRENTPITCDRTRALSDPLMDHPRLPAACKDTIWEMLQASAVMATNTYQRRDSIDRPARRLTVVCADPVKPAAPATPTGPRPGGLNPSQT